LLSKLGYNATATDIDNNVLKYVLEKKKEFNADMKVFKMDMLNLDFKDKNFDIVFHQGILENFDDETITYA
jgi:ubiquinone/menaquinone biosynthesis C-methylase UbiE